MENINLTRDIGNRIGTRTGKQLKPISREEFSKLFIAVDRRDPSKFRRWFMFFQHQMFNQIRINDAPDFD